MMFAQLEVLVTNCVEFWKQFETKGRGIAKAMRLVSKSERQADADEGFGS